MAAAKPDRRTQRTKAALMSAFVDLVLTRGYEAVTVEGIAARANVGRSTFYMHHTGKEAILRLSLTHPSAGLAKLADGDATAEQLLPLLAHFREQRARNKVFFAPAVRQIWIKVLADMIAPRLKARAPLLPLDVVAREIAEAQIALVVYWLSARPTLKPPAVAEALVALTHALIASLARPA